jgi:hypothetical protein
MSNDAPEVEKLSMANTKKEMLQAYNRVLKQLTEKRRAAMKPAEERAEKRKSEARAVADALSTEAIGRQIGVLKSEVGNTLNELADRLEAETSKYAQVRIAVEAAEAELREIYEIEKTASSLAALVEAQREKQEAFEAEMAGAREEFETEMNWLREEWKREKAQHEATQKEKNAAEQKRREREEEEYRYQFERQRQSTLEQYEHEAELKQLREKVEQYPGELEKAVSHAVDETTKRLEREAQNRINLLEKESIGERNVLHSRIEALEGTVEKQAEQITRLSQQLEHSYRQVQEIAVKAIEGPSVSRAASHLQAPAAPDLPPRSTQRD